MICTYSFFEGCGHVQYLKNVATMMKGANNVAFLNIIELKIFIENLKKTLEDSKTGRNKNSTAHLSVIMDKKGEGMISVFQQDCSSNSVLRLYVHPVDVILEYDLDVRAFFDVSDRLEEKGGKQ